MKNFLFLSLISITILWMNPNLESRQYNVDYLITLIEDGDYSDPCSASEKDSYDRVHDHDSWDKEW